MVQVQVLYFRVTIEWFQVQSLLMVCGLSVDGLNHLVTFPQPPVVELGSNFTATCVVINTTEVTADDLYWNLSGTTLPRELYSKINSTALSVTFTITSERQEWLLCQCGKTSPDVFLYLSRISSFFLLRGKTNHSATRDKRAQVFLGTFPDHTNLEIWVEAHNKLGRADSRFNISLFNPLPVKTNPPDNVTVMSETTFPTSLLLTWTPPINKNYVRLRYRIRFCPEGAHTWSDVKATGRHHEQTHDGQTESWIRTRLKMNRQKPGSEPDSCRTETRIRTRLMLNRQKPGSEPDSY
uniref:Fibronectin type-III domain-containing protein n=1 Tax=Labrus bergylta TaxID=56723 RepID=A0A3Q3GL41_9LABR